MALNPPRVDVAVAYVVQLSSTGSNKGVMWQEVRKVTDRWQRENPKQVNEWATILWGHLLARLAETDEEARLAVACNDTEVAKRAQATRGMLRVALDAIEEEFGKS